MEAASPPPSPQPAAAPPGWYPDPQGSGHLRWWDGTQWGALAPATRSGEGGIADGWVIGGAVAGLLIPIVGLIWAIVLLAKGEKRGWIVVAASLVGGAIGYALVVSSS